MAVYGMRRSCGIAVYGMRRSCGKQCINKGGDDEIPATERCCSLCGRREVRSASRPPNGLILSRCNTPGGPSKLVHRGHSRAGTQGQAWGNGISTVPVMLKLSCAVRVRWKRGRLNWSLSKSYVCPPPLISKLGPSRFRP